LPRISRRSLFRSSWGADGSDHQRRNNDQRPLVEIVELPAVDLTRQASRLLSGSTRRIARIQQKTATQPDHRECRDEFQLRLTVHLLNGTSLPLFSVITSL